MPCLYGTVWTMRCADSWALVPSRALSHKAGSGTADQQMLDADAIPRGVAYLPASALTAVFSIVRRHADIPTAFAAVDRVFAAFGLPVVDAALLQQARALPGTDFEDNVQGLPRVR